MEFYPSPKRLRSDEYDIPVSSCSYTFTTSDEYSTGALGLPVSHPPAESYQSWASGFQYPAVFDLDIVQKRRRVDGSEESSMPYSTFSSYEHHAGTPYQRPDYNQSFHLQTYEHNGAGSSTLASPIARSMASLSFLFSPCCGFDQEQSGRGGRVSAVARSITPGSYPWQSPCSGKDDIKGGPLSTQG
ncbi:hypothetical protein B0I35DRAFT_35060 [Stachybotrys elegans]|uniref:Uncharacterized protein n=1 Tax=Stachybotrys elegans TaxID=80388 RepID=A0A8K0T2L3_9HYPO|nr:hypothetical protein B0I35DRAFT_35060 [Stachybotrys elegans]